MRLFIMCASMSPQPSPAATHLVYERLAGDSTSRRKKGLREQATHDGMSLRRLLADMIEEYARHTGHADLLREHVDGATGEGAPQDFPVP
jgi:hypothetical protein